MAAEQRIETDPNVTNRYIAKPFMPRIVRFYQWDNAFDVVIWRGVFSTPYFHYAVVRPLYDLVEGYTVRMLSGDLFFCLGNQLFAAM